jgi:hypothetical protein
MSEACSNCRYFLLEDNAALLGICRRFPATVMFVKKVDDTVYIHTTFPQMMKTGWCGEHKVVEK